jgi:peptidyl-prolyl cis-trans isomerase B (cyclophilin B)
MRAGALFAAALLTAVLLSGCGGKKSSSTASTSPSTGTTAAVTSCPLVSLPEPGSPKKATKPTQLLPADKTYDVTFVTNCGSFTFRLDQAQSPHAVASIVALVQNGFYNHTIFHRIVPGFVIQGGDPSGTGTGGPGYTTVDKPPKNAEYTHGVVAMAKTPAQLAGTAGSQFFIVTEANADLTPDYAIVGKVIKGLDVVDRIGKLGDASQQPTQIIEIQRATVKTS